MKIIMLISDPFAAARMRMRD